MDAQVRKSSIVIAGYYGFGNAGDELILHSLIQKFRRDQSDCIITVLSNHPAATRRDFDVYAVNRWRPWQWILPLARAERFILGGGGLLQESTGGWNHLYYLGLVVKAKFCGCKTSILAIGVDPISGVVNRFWTRWVLNHFADRLSVRDAASREALKGAGVGDPIHIEGDPVFDLPRKPANAQSRQGIALAVSPQPGRPMWSQEVAQLCDTLQERLPMPIDILLFFPAQDAVLARDISRRSRAVRSIRIWENPRDLLAWIPSYQMIIGTRFHALVLASNSELPFIGWGEQLKVKSLCLNKHQPYWNGQGSWSLEERCTQIVAKICGSRSFVGDRNE